MGMQSAVMKIQSPPRLQGENCRAISTRCTMSRSIRETATRRTCHGYVLVSIGFVLQVLDIVSMCLEKGRHFLRVTLIRSPDNY